MPYEIDKKYAAVHEILMELVKLGYENAKNKDAVYIDTHAACKQIFEIINESSKEEK